MRFSGPVAALTARRVGDSVESPPSSASPTLYQGMFSPLLPTRARPSHLLPHFSNLGHQGFEKRLHQFSSDGLISSTFDLESIRMGSLERASLTNGQGECSTKSKSSIGTDAVRHSCSKLGNRFRQLVTAGRPLVQVNRQKRAPRHLLYASSEIVRRKSDNAQPFTDVPYPPHDAGSMGGLPAWAIQVARGLRLFQE